MSVTDPADAVQPDDAGQGDGGTAGDPPYADFLNRIPEELRGDVEPVFRDWDAQTTQRFQEHSDYRRTWEPYQDSGVTQYDPEAVQNALAFYEAAANNPQSIKQWYEETYAPAHNLLAAQPPADAPPEFGQDFGSLDQQQIAELKEQLSSLQQQSQEFSSWRQQQEETRQLEYGQQIIDQQLSELKSKHGDEFTDSAKEWVEDRANSKYVGDPMNAIPRAWQDYQALVNHISKQVIQSKVDSPAPAEGGGVPDTSPEKITDFKQAQEIAAQFLRNENRA